MYHRCNIYQHHGIGISWNRFWYFKRYPIRGKKNETQRGKVICLKPTSKFPPWNLHSYLSDPKVHTPSRSVSCWWPGSWCVHVLDHWNEIFHPWFVEEFFLNICKIKHPQLDSRPWFKTSLQGMMGLFIPLLVQETHVYTTQQEATS